VTEIDLDMEQIRSEICLICMMRIKFRILIALLTLLIGSGSEAVWDSVIRQPLSLCTLSENPAAYDGKTVRVRGNLLVSDKGIVALGEFGCGERSGVGAEVIFKSKRQLVERLRRLNSYDYWVRTEVVIIPVIHFHEHDVRNSEAMFRQ
jgi:hypothetical protein